MKGETCIVQNYIIIKAMTGVDCVIGMQYIGSGSLSLHISIQMQHR